MKNPLIWVMGLFAPKTSSKPKHHDDWTARHAALNQAQDLLGPTGFTRYVPSEDPARDGGWDCAIGILTKHRGPHGLNLKFTRLVVAPTWHEAVMMLREEASKCVKEVAK
jgi:hypothetical protein